MMKRLLLLLVLTGLCGLGVVAQTALEALAAPATPFRSGDRIVCFGDSITRFGNGPTGYVGLLRAAFTAPGASQVTVYDAGVGGDTTVRLQSRVAQDVLARHPSIVFVAVGLNDASWFFDWNDAQSQVRYEAALRDVVAKIQAQGAVVVLATPTIFGEQHWGTNKFDAHIDTCVAINRKVAQDMQVPLCDLHALFLDYLSTHNPDNKASGILTVDKVHLSDLGNALWAEAVAKSLAAALQAAGRTPFVPGSRFLDSDQVTIIERAPLARGATLRYTTDGTEPGAKSSRYRQPFRVTATTTVQARVFIHGQPVSPTVSGTYTHMPLRAPDRADAVVDGLQYQYYEGEWQQLPDIGTLTPVATGTVATFDWAPRKKEFNYAMHFSGYIKVETPGIYTFYTDSGDGSRLKIGDTVLVDNDGTHPPAERDGQIALLPGLHVISVDYLKFWGAGNAGFEVGYAGPAVPRQVIPANVLFH
jgi:lysophospholipase L1-like esterase